MQGAKPAGYESARLGARVSRREQKKKPSAVARKVSCSLLPVRLVGARTGEYTVATVTANRVVYFGATHLISYRKSPLLLLSFLGGLLCRLLGRLLLSGFLCHSGITSFLDLQM
jgi:hypothetical protein